MTGVMILIFVFFISLMILNFMISWSLQSIEFSTGNGLSVMFPFNGML